MAGRALRCCVVLVTALSCAGCLYYDSRWGQAKASQKRVAAQRMPGQLRGEAKETTLPPGEQPSAPARALRLRAYATRHYAGALVDGEAQFQQAIDHANPTLAHHLAFRLELVDYQVWPSAVSDDDLAALLVEVRRADPASDVDWVVVLASPRDMVATSADHLGMGDLLGRYLAIRAMSDAAEFDVIQKGYTELSEEEKRRLYVARKQHKWASVLLHEIGHTLGMPHELDRHSLMNATYRSDANAFSSHAARLGQRALALRDTVAGTELHRGAAQAALNVLRGAPEHTWDASSASAVERLLEQHARPRATNTAVTARLAPKPTASQRSAVQGPPPALTESDRSVFEQARRAQAEGRIAQARELAAPLFEAYPNIYAVQDLRCQLAMKAGLSMEAERTECAPLLKLTGTGF